MTELMRPVKLDALGAGERAMSIDASDAERTALAARFGLISLDRLTATATLHRDGDTVRAEGRIDAAVVQACVATGDPLPATIAEAFALRFVPADALTADAELELAPADLDTIPYTGAAIDVGEAVAETLALALDPFPRSADADAALKAAGVLKPEDAGPFAMLKGLRGKLS